MREESWPTSKQRGIRLRLVHPSGVRRWDRRSPSVVCRHSFPAEPRQTTQNDGLSHSAFFSSRAKTDHAKRWSVQVCPTRHSFPAEPRQTTQNDGLSHSAFFSSRAKTDHAKRWSVRSVLLLPAGGHYLLGFAEHGFGLGEVLHGLQHFRIVHKLGAVRGLLIESAQVELVADLLRHPLLVAVPIRVGEGDGDGAR